ncbi:MAG: very short patch repair endonuclease [Deltaproteobacteria bacterium]|nr:very short patch repair endonuclease [Deltaproteobacteria bacterium]
MSAETRSRLMARIRSANTKPERIVFAELRKRRIAASRHVSDLPGRPDIVISGIQLAVFIDGDFWHGWRFPLWMHKLEKGWRQKIATTRKRDQRNFRKLRLRGWTVLRLWEH